MRSSPFILVKYLYGLHQIPAAPMARRIRRSRKNKRLSSDNGYEVAGYSVNATALNGPFVLERM